MCACVCKARRSIVRKGHRPLSAARWLRGGASISLPIQAVREGAARIHSQPPGRKCAPTHAVDVNGEATRLAREGAAGCEALG